MTNDGIFDVLIIGGGPAGLSAAVNARARQAKCLLIDSNEPVNRLKWCPEINNYLGFPKSSGADLADHFARHFASSGCTFAKEKVLKIMPNADVFAVGTGENVYMSKTVVMAIGVARSKMLPGEEEFLGRGVSYCVTCDGALFSGGDIVVVGYSSEGECEANELAKYARSVTYLPAYEQVGPLDASIKLLRDTPVSIHGDTNATSLKTGNDELKADGIFLIREATPVSTLVDGLTLVSDFIHVDRSMATNISGIYAAGDCTGKPFQLAKAVGEGQVAALNAAKQANSPVS